MTGTLDMTAEPQGATLVLRLSGVLDHESSVGVADASELPRPAVVVLDLRELELATAAGTRLLDEFAARQRANGAACFLVAEPGSGLARTLRALGVDEFLRSSPPSRRHSRRPPAGATGRNRWCSLAGWRSCPATCSASGPSAAPWATWSAPPST